MGFLSFGLEYYKTELNRLENVAASAQTIYHAKQLLKMLDDLLDEGYTELNTALEETCSGVSRLRAYLKYNHAEPFAVYRKPLSGSDVAYEQHSFELTDAIEELVEKAEKSTVVCDNAFLSDLIRFCNWIGHEKNTAYIFLLRDTLLPYVYYLSKHRHGFYPWLLGRQTLSMLTGADNVDDEIRACVYNALEHGKCGNYNDFCDAVLPDIRSVSARYPETEKRLISLLGKIKQERIIAVESGCSGTFPLLLMSLDPRVDMRMYTTYPYLSEIYGDRIYTSEYEKSRLFETLYSQDLYFRIAELHDDRFFVVKCKNKEAEEHAVAEIKTVLELSESDTL